MVLAQARRASAFPSTRTAMGPRTGRRSLLAAPAAMVQIRSLRSSMKLAYPRSRIIPMDD
jgi:hypothetical protein